ncbi:hypothetical protein JRI60_48820 [Archangium violaceum]|uniref:hypothetical protein n=1 Tax=Archangium violaceum TaxID=83451 RepID=UPI00194ECA05|nr:hypothetical protein [Archangium violaceum]QRN96802.1 hypothetical protein JRI60_48820 [Archangium violaceum]
MRHILIGIVAAALFSGCGAPKSVVQEQLESFADEQEGKERVIELRETDAARGLVIHCPLGVLCDEHYDYRHYSYDARGIYLSLSFEPVVVKDMTLESLRAHAQHVSYELKEVEGLEATGWRIGARSVVHRVGQPDFQVRFTGLQDGRLKGEIRTTLVELVGRQTADATCENPPQDAPMPDHCYASARANIPLRIVFDLPIQEGVLDCRDGQTPGCG